MSTISYAQRAQLGRICIETTSHSFAIDVTSKFDHGFSRGCHAHDAALITYDAIFIAAGAQSAGATENYNRAGRLLAAICARRHTFIYAAPGGLSRASPQKIALDVTSNHRHSKSAVVSRSTNTGITAVSGPPHASTSISPARVNS